MKIVPIVLGLMLITGLAYADSLEGKVEAVEKDKVTLRTKTGETVYLKAKDTAGIEEGSDVKVEATKTSGNEYDLVSIETTTEVTTEVTAEVK